MVNGIGGHKYLRLMNAVKWRRQCKSVNKCQAVRHICMDSTTHWCRNPWLCKSIDRLNDTIAGSLNRWGLIIRSSSRCALSRAKHILKCLCIRLVWHTFWLRVANYRTYVVTSLLVKLRHWHYPLRKHCVYGMDVTKFEYVGLFAQQEHVYIHRFSSTSTSSGSR